MFSYQRPTYASAHNTYIDASAKCIQFRRRETFDMQNWRFIRCLPNIQESAVTKVGCRNASSRIHVNEPKTFIDPRN